MSSVSLRQLSSALLAATALLSSTCHAAIHQELTPMLLAETFDYIVVGGGASGAVLANRLSEDSNVSVLLVEAGSSDFNNSAIELPAQAAVLHNTQFDWNFTTTPQASFDNRSLAYPRGHVLGGSTAINQMAFCRGSKDDYDRWARVTNDSGWSWDTLFPYFLNLDRLTTPADHHNTTGQFDPTAHGQTGLLNTSLNGFLVETAPRSIAASAELSSQFPFNLDYNSGDTIGLSFSQATIFNGARFTSAHGYIVPALERPNLQIVVNSFVSRVLPTGSQDGIPAFRSIEVLNLTSNATVTVNATREVILSAGAVKSPHILMLSGIGNSTHISSSGIQPLVDLPDVGQNLQDHVFLTLNWNVTPGVFTLDQSRENATFAAEARAQWTATRTGPWTITVGDTWGWFRIPGNSPLFENATDPSAGPTSAHYEFILVDSFSGKTITPPATGNFFTMTTNLIQPASRGSITLASPDPSVHPTIDPNMLSAPLDMAILVEAVKAARTFMSATAWQGWITGEFGTFAEATTDEDIEAYVRANADSVDHVSGTVAMGREGCTDSGCGALNPDLTVKGTSGLRVVDASAFPFIISGHTQGAAYILAERAADIIKAAA